MPSPVSRRHGVEMGNMIHAWASTVAGERIGQSCSSSRAQFPCLCSRGENPRRALTICQSLTSTTPRGWPASLRSLGWQSTCHPLCTRGSTLTSLPTVHLNPPFFRECRAQTAKWAKSSSRGSPCEEERGAGGARPSLRISCDGSWASAMDTQGAPSSTAGSYCSPPAKVLGPTFAKPIRVQY